MKYRAASFGFGVIGQMVAKTILEQKKDWLELVAAIDIDPSKVGMDIGEILGTKKYGVKVTNSISQAIKEKPDIVIHTTSSYFEKTFPELRELVENRVNVISSCEELSYPYFNRKLARELDSIAKKNDVSVLGTGINPGFVMDVLPIVLTAPCIKIKRIRVARQMNAATRRIPFQKKIGAGLSKKEFSLAIKHRAITGHVGLRQSISMLADSLSWKLDKIVIEEPRPVVLAREVQSKWKKIYPGTVAGTSQAAFGLANGRKVIDYRFKAYIGAKSEFDLVDIDGTPKVHFKSNPCINGDSGTIAMLINMIPKVINGKSGLLTMRDLTLPSSVSA